MLLIRACGRWTAQNLAERACAAERCRRQTSSGPVHFARASTLRNGLPITTLLSLPLCSFVCHFAIPDRLLQFDAAAHTFKPVHTLARRFDRLAPHPGRRQFNRFIDLDVAGASAKISGQGLLNLSRDGFGFFSNNSFATSRNPGEQYPHCAAPRSAKVSCSG